MALESPLLGKLFFRTIPGPPVGRRGSSLEELHVGIEKTTRLISTRSEVNANLLLTAGWTLLLVADPQEGEYQWVQYQFGWQHEGEPRDIAFTGVEDGPPEF